MLWSLPFANYRTQRQAYPDARSSTRRWITALEEETGAVSLKFAAVSATDLVSRQANSRGHAYPPSPFDEGKILPDFFDGTYEEVLETCQKEGKIACVILVSDEHDDVPEFKRSTLTDPGFIRILGGNNFVVWGGDVRDKDAWDAAQKLQATTYPFVAFVALQPRRSHSPTASSPSATPVLTVLSRHHGPSVPESGQTSASTLSHHLEEQLLPRVAPFLTRLNLQFQEREKNRLLREQQDRAFLESAERDRGRIQARIQADQAEAERLRIEEEARHQEQHRLAVERERKEISQAQRLQWRRWMRRCIVPSESEGGTGIRLALKLPGNSRIIWTFPLNSTLTDLYAFADTQMIPPTLQPESDPEQMLEGSRQALNEFEHYLHSQITDPESWWGFRLTLAYPRREVKWMIGTSLSDVGLQSGEQLVMEMIDDRLSLASDDDYESEDE